QPFELHGAAFRLRFAPSDARESRLATVHKPPSRSRGRGALSRGKAASAAIPRARMRSAKVIHVVSCHAEGEVGDVIVGGVATPPGATIWEQSRFIARDQTLRNSLLNEPRGGVFRHFNLLVPSVDPRAATGWIIMEPADTPPMSGSNAICVATVLL